MKQGLIVITCLIAALQLKLWCEHDGVMGVLALKQAIAEQEEINQRASQRNAALYAQIDDLKSGTAAIEEYARQELGFIRKGEVFFQFVQK